MKKLVVPKDTPAAWDADALYAKAERYSQHMTDLDSDDWEFALWSSLTLELLGRAALANISPVLLADTDKTWSNTYHAMGFDPTEEKFAPKSIAISDVFRRLSSILPDFNKEHENFGILHTGRRNSELHSGEAVFDGMKGSTWQPRFYETCNILLNSMGMTLKDFWGQEEAEVAQKLIDAAADDGAKAVRGEVDAHRKVWLSKSDEERDTLTRQAAVWATRQTGHRVDCPACTSTALVSGDPVAAPVQRLVNGEIIHTQEYLPNQFQCVACTLKISGLSRLAVVGLSDRYKKTQVFDPAEYYAPAEDEYAGYDDDNNEY